MTIQLGNLAWAARLAGIRFPGADEDALARCARAWHGAAEQLRLVPPSAAAIGTRVAAAVAGETAARFAELWRPVGALDGPIGRLADACDAIAAGCARAAVEVEHAKLVIRAELVVLAASVTAVSALPGVGPVGAFVIAQAIAAARLAALTVLERLLSVLGGNIAAGLDLRGVVAHAPGVLDLLTADARAGGAELGAAPGAGQGGGDRAVGGGAGGGYVARPVALFGSAPADLPVAFGTARALLLAELRSAHHDSPQRMAWPPSTADMVGGGGPVLAGGPSAPGAPSSIAPAPVVAPPAPQPDPVGPAALPATPPPRPEAPVRPATPVGPPVPSGTPVGPPVGASPVPRPGPPIRPAPAVVPPKTPAGPPPPGVGAAPGPPAGAGTSPSGPHPMVVGLAGPGLAADPGGIARRARLGEAARPVPGPAVAAGGCRGINARRRPRDGTRAEGHTQLRDAEALALARAAMFTTDAGYGFYPAGDVNRELARAVPPVAGQVTVDLLGDAAGFLIGGGRLAPVQFARVLRELIGTGELTVPPGEGIRLVSGAAAEHAATLAAELRIEVLASDGCLCRCPGGAQIVAACLAAGRRREYSALPGVD